MKWHRTRTKRSGVLARSIAALPWVFSLCLLAPPTANAAAPAVEEESVDLLIVGGTESGWAAAIQAARAGVKSILIVHDGRWLGGQFTEQALACVDENKGVGKVGWGAEWHPMKRSFHRSGLFSELMDRIESHNKAKYGTRMPGRPIHGPSTFRPVEAEAIFRRMLQPYIDQGQVKLVLNHYPVRADVSPGEHPRLRGIWFAQSTDLDRSPRADLHVSAKITIDASDWGEAIQAAGADYECGPDARSKYGEPSAPLDLANNPHAEMNPLTWAMIVVEDDKAAPLPQPANFDDHNFVRTSRLSLKAMKGLAWDRPVKLGSILHWPPAGKASPRQLSVYTVRRIVDGETSREGKTMILLNYMLGQDYPLERLPARVVEALESTERGASEKNIVEMSRRQRQIIFDDAKQHSLSVLYHLQTFVHDRADDTANSFRGFRLSDEFETADGLPPKPYIRESLRLKAMYMMREQDGRNRDGATKSMARERFAEVLYPDGVFAWQFHYDFHRTGRAYLRSEGRKGPWIDFEKPGRHTSHVSDRSVFPLRSLVPIRMDGLIGAQKNVGYSSIVCAAIRLHDQGVAIGQAAGAAAAVSLQHNVPPRDLPLNRRYLEQVRSVLCGDVELGRPLLLWPYRDLPCQHASFVAINRLAALGALPVEAREVDFHPDSPAIEAWRKAVVARSEAILSTTTPLPLPPAGAMSRGEFCQRWWRAISPLPLLPFPKRMNATDADGDGIRDHDDPSPHTAGPPIAFVLRLPGNLEDGRPETPKIREPKNAKKGAVRRFNFSGPSHRLDGYSPDHGEPFTSARGYGWASSLTANHRSRSRNPDQARDSFLFTRTKAAWECAVENGRWRVTTCVGDASHEQAGQLLTVEGEVFVNDQTTATGWFLETSQVVQVRDGRLTIQLGPQRDRCNTCLNWLLLERLE